MNENTTTQVIEATEGVAAVAKSVNWRKIGKGAGIVGMGIALVTGIGAGIGYVVNKIKQNAEASEDDQVEELDSIESEEE